ncbi:hypothetical protein COU62_04545 [Candidatus Pacearchaeota archaeon CG10_big_fil_rev_8_21_14_0_10_35_219]|nr:MAG: hypothetical protein AUJ63_04980 [Candidatus Pacearchaeota archaeon CG1_02_35_32]PIO07260.1 MAG: hypothetical protein COU62_04545 [Candidatus Pacearchaeota archaeon CG10_big_fil_rev_8_21_14_0_10_35_219]PIY81172.1 MAG: hypothetical protein COY79_03970 [Candidatus Pacearchaeota archaeon CG_4_10_14_0_8_um_filter_35_169]PIZ79423.1 MAG: hypothetical protein COY00_03975 [Candidatus Pacearchaeota archaeon CG_4_10_14_0_2_um_filter_35_33]PJB93987.1 MAG: hypothetical protein CO081_03500 [Candidat
MKKILDYSWIINGRKYNLTIRKIIDLTKDYFKVNKAENCFLSQGDPILNNIGYKPVFFDFETAGFNPIVAEASIFFWGVFIAEVYFNPKYHKSSYYRHQKVTKDGLNKPQIKYSINEKSKTIELEIAYSISERQRFFLSAYHNFIKQMSQREFLNFSHFLTMRALTTLDIKKYSKKDVMTTLAILVLLYKNPISKVFNTDSLS